MCNFDGFFRLLKEMSIAQNLYINVSIVLFSITFVLASLITLINFLTNNFSYKDLINIVDNTEFLEMSMYIQMTDTSIIDYFDDYGMIFSIFSNIENFYERTGDEFLMRDEVFDNYVKDVLIFDNNNLTADKFLNFENSNKILLKKLSLRNFSSIVYSRNDLPKSIYNNLNKDKIDANFERAKILMKQGFLFLNMIRKIKFSIFDLNVSNKQKRFIDRIFFNLRDSNAYFYLTGKAERFNFNPEKHLDLIAGKYLEMVRKIFNARLFCDKNKGNLLQNIATNPLFLDKEDKISDLFSNANPNLINEEAYKPVFLALINYFDAESFAKIFAETLDESTFYANPAEFNNMLSLNNTIINKIKEVFKKSSQNFFIFSDLDFLENLASLVYSFSEYQILPIFATADEKMALLNKKHCYLFRQSLSQGKIKNASLSDLNSLQDCFLDNDAETQKTKLWNSFVNNSPSLLNLNNSTYFDFCTYEDIIDEPNNYYKFNETFLRVPRKFCLNRFSLKKRLENPKESGKAFKFLNSMMPLLSYNTEAINFPISNYYLSVFLKNEGIYQSFETKQKIKILANLFTGMYLFVSISLILILYFIYNIVKVKDFIDQPLKKIESTLSNISDKVKFKDSKKYLDEYLLEDDSKTINEFKYLIKMILKLVEGNLILKKPQLKANDLDLMHSYNEIQPINMVKFNRYIVFENKILEGIDKNQYCLELTERSGAEMAKDEKLKSSAIYVDLIQKKFLQEKINRISQDFIGTSKYSEENFKTKYQTLEFEEFRSSKIRYAIDDVFKADWMKVDEILDSFYLEVNEIYMEDWYKDYTNNNVLYNYYDEIFNC